ncbi:MAG: toxin-antitoxin system HicB family antitoxin [Candidatus Marithrix sp.]
MKIVTPKGTIANEKHDRLKEYTKTKHQSLNKLFDELATVALAQFDAQTRFKMMASKGDKEIGLELLNKLDNS